MRPGNWLELDSQCDVHMIPMGPTCQRDVGGIYGPHMGFLWAEKNIQPKGPLHHHQTNQVYIYEANCQLNN